MSWRSDAVRFLATAQEQLNRIRTDLERPSANDGDAVLCVVHNLKENCEQAAQAITDALENPA